MKIAELLNKLKLENENILNRNPSLSHYFDWSPDAYTLQLNEKFIERLKQTTAYKQKE